MGNFLLKRGRRLGLLSIIALLLVIAAIFALRKPALNFDPYVGRAILPPVKIPQFNMIDHRGQPFNNGSLVGHWTLTMIGFTYCPDICPTILMELAAFFSQLEAMPGFGKAPEFVFLSVDPYRDTPEELGKYVAYFHKSFVGVTGKPENINKLATELGSYYAYTTPEDDHVLDDVLHRPAMKDYGVIHSSRVLAISPQGELVAIMTPPFRPENCLVVLKKLRSYYGD